MAVITAAPISVSDLNRRLCQRVFLNDKSYLTSAVAGDEGVTSAGPENKQRIFLCTHLYARGYRFVLLVNVCIVGQGGEERKMMAVMQGWAKR